MQAAYFKIGCKIKNEYIYSNKEVENMESKYYKNYSKIYAKVNYNNPKKGMTSINYTKSDGTEQSLFIDGIYNGNLEITIKGKILNNESITKIREV